MRLLPKRLTKILKAFVPTTLFARAMMILVVPIILVQLFAIFMFYERHWDSIVRNMSNSLAGDVHLLVRQFEEAPAEERIRRTAEMADTLGFGLEFDGTPNAVAMAESSDGPYGEFLRQLAQRVEHPATVQSQGGDDILISILLDDGLLKLRTTKKRLISSTTYIFIMWMAGSSIFLAIIAMLFLRNQVRPIRQLARAATLFGIGQDSPDFSPRGAAEVRQAGHAFLIMRNRIMRQISTRTEMLAGISHDLRTPLTRIRLQLELLALDADIRAGIQSDLNQMEHMITDYLDFARGEGREQGEDVAIQPYLREITEHYIRLQQAVTLACGTDINMKLRPKAMRRALQNVIDNALRYGEVAHVKASADGIYLYITVEDEGPGIPVEAHDDVFRPFKRLEQSRNSETGGSGLGLSIARDVVQSHGGTISLQNREEKGLAVTIRLPITGERPVSALH